MVLTPENFLIIGSILVILSIVVGKTGYRMGVPSLLVFLFMGMLFGSDGVGLQFSNPKQAQVIGMISLLVILFSGGMDTKLREIKPVAVQGIILSTAGVLITAVLTAVFIFALTKVSFFGIEMPFIFCLLLASTMSSTDSASVFSILRSKSLHLKENLRPLLELESGSNDPMAYMLTIACIQMISIGSAKIDTMLWLLIIQFVIGLISGFIFGRFIVWLINHIELDYNSIASVLVLAVALLCFGITDAFKGNGYLAVYIAGLVVGNSDVMYKKNMISFFDGMTWLVQIILFIALGLLVNPLELLPIAAAAVAIAIFMTLVGRPLTVWFCLLFDKTLSRNARLYVSWVGLRGAVPIIFATYPQVAKVPYAQTIFNIVFFITIISLIVQGTTVPYAAKYLNLTDDDVEKRDFALDLPDDIASAAQVEASPAMVKEYASVGLLPLPEHTFVAMIKREGQYIVPDAKTELTENDKLLIISDEDKKLTETAQTLNPKKFFIYKD